MDCGLHATVQLALGQTAPVMQHCWHAGRDAVRCQAGGPLMKGNTHQQSAPSSLPAKVVWSCKERTRSQMKVAVGQTACLGGSAYGPGQEAQLYVFGVKVVELHTQRSMAEVTT